MKPATPFKKILIANRGEIAVRVIRACREMGIATVAVFSDVDRAALHVMKADEAYPIGPASAAESYLNVERILDVAKRSGTEAIHPGYGFLSENPQFAKACGEAGIKFIGPSAAAMEAMGSKTRARQAADHAGLPRVPGSVCALASGAEADEVAASVGYPVMLKAAAGGGGKGMRRVEMRDQLASAFAAAHSEALRASLAEIMIKEAQDLLTHSSELTDITVRQLKQLLLNAAEGPMTNPDLTRETVTRMITMAAGSASAPGGTLVSHD